MKTKYLMKQLAPIFSINVSFNIKYLARCWATFTQEIKLFLMNMMDN